jgi:hypothetical protein
MLPQNRVADNVRSCKIAKSMQSMMKGAERYEYIDWMISAQLTLFIASDKLYLTSVSGVPSLVIT